MPLILVLNVKASKGDVFFTFYFSFFHPSHLSKLMLLQCMPKYLNCFTYLVFPYLHRTYPDMNPEKSRKNAKGSNCGSVFTFAGKIQEKMFLQKSLQWKLWILEEKKCYKRKRELNNSKKMQPNDIIGKTLKQLNDLKKILPIDCIGKTLKHLTRSILQCSWKCCNICIRVALHLDMYILGHNWLQYMICWFQNKSAWLFFFNFAELFSHMACWFFFLISWHNFSIL